MRCKRTDQSAAAVVCLMSPPANGRRLFTYIRSKRICRSQCGVTFLSIREESSHVIKIEILYFDIQFFCHSADRPAFFMGKGEFEAIYYTGNYDINDTIVEKVIEYEFLEKSAAS